MCIRDRDSTADNAKNYIKLMGSIDAVRQTKENGQKEIKQLEELRKSGKLIDISRRDIPNPNEALKQALADIRAAAGKFLCLPHKLCLLYTSSSFALIKKSPVNFSL